LIDLVWSTDLEKGFKVQYAVLGSTVFFGIFILGLFIGKVRIICYKVLYIICYILYGFKLYIVRKKKRAKGTPERVEDSFSLPLVILTWIGTDTGLSIFCNEKHN